MGKGNGDKNGFLHHGAGPASPARSSQRDGEAVALSKPFLCVTRSSGILRDGVAHALQITHDQSLIAYSFLLPPLTHQLGLVGRVLFL